MPTRPSSAGPGTGATAAVEARSTATARAADAGRRDEAPATRAVTTTCDTDLWRTLAPLRHGRADPAFRITADGAVWRATLMPAGPATLRLVAHGPRRVWAEAWGPGAHHALATVPALLGEHDDLAGFDPPPGPVRDAHRRFAGVRMTRSARVLESLVPAILEQRVITSTAHDAWRYLLHRHGTPAPGPAPAGMRVPPSPGAWAATPVWDFHRAGVDPRRARTVVAAASVAHALEAVGGLGHEAAAERLCAVPGVGPWTAAETLQRALGDADAVPVGDVHLPGQVGWALRRERVDDAGMLVLLEPYRPHRMRAVRLLLLSGAARVPRRGPRLAVEDHRAR